MLKYLPNPIYMLSVELERMAEELMDEDLATKRKTRCL